MMRPLVRSSAIHHVPHTSTSVRGHARCSVSLAHPFPTRSLAGYSSRPEIPLSLSTHYPLNWCVTAHFDSHAIQCMSESSCRYSAWPCGLARPQCIWLCLARSWLSTSFTFHVRRRCCVNRSASGTLPIPRTLGGGSDDHHRASAHCHVSHALTLACVLVIGRSSGTGCCYSRSGWQAGISALGFGYIRRGSCIGDVCRQTIGLVRVKGSVQ